MSKGLGKTEKRILEFISQNRLYEEGLEGAIAQAWLVSELNKEGIKTASVIRAIKGLENKGLVFGVIDEYQGKLVDIMPIEKIVTRNAFSFKLEYEKQKDREKVPDLIPFIDSAIEQMGRKPVTNKDYHRLSRIFRRLLKEKHPEFFYGRNRYGTTGIYLKERVIRQYQRTLKKYLEFNF